MSARSRSMVVVAWLVPTGILIQALVAGRGLFLDPELFELHGGIGHGVLALAVVAATMFWLTPTPRMIALLASATVLGLIGQTGLGYTGRRSAAAIASSLHIPLGVSLLGLSAVVAVLATQAGLRETRGDETAHEQ